MQFSSSSELPTRRLAQDHESNDRIYANSFQQASILPCTKSIFNYLLFDTRAGCQSLSSTHCCWTIHSTVILRCISVSIATAGWDRYTGKGFSVASKNESRIVSQYRLTFRTWILLCVPKNDSRTCSHKNHYIRLHRLWSSVHLMLLVTSLSRICRGSAELLLVKLCHDVIRYLSHQHLHPYLAG